MSTSAATTCLAIVGDNCVTNTTWVAAQPVERSLDPGQLVQIGFATLLFALAVLALSAAFTLVYHHVKLWRDRDECDADDETGASA